MRILQQRLLHVHGRIRSIEFTARIQLLRQALLDFSEKFSAIHLTRTAAFFWLKFLQLFKSIESIGFTQSMEDYDRRKLGVFNQLNFYQLVTGIIVPVAGLLSNEKIPLMAPSTMTGLALKAGKERYGDNW